MTNSNCNEAASTQAIVHAICNAVAELPDRNSPPDWPEAMLVTHDELAEIVRTAIEEAGAKNESQPESLSVKAVQEPLVRYCPGCGSIGSVEAKYRDCCPDGNEARLIPQALAKKCRYTFKLAVAELLAQNGQDPTRVEPVVASVLAALDDAHSVISSINTGPSHQVRVNEEVCFWQREEWVRWAVDDVLPRVVAARSLFK